MQKKTTKEEEFAVIYEKYRHDVYKLAIYFTEDPYTADDITQKIFFKLYLHFDNIRNKENIRAYLLKSARNLAYNWVRDKHESMYIENVPEEDILLESLENNYVKNEHDRRIQMFLAQILEEIAIENESWYDIINLIYCLGKTHEEAAEELGITMQVLYSKFYRAKRWIRKNYEKVFDEIMNGGDS